MDGIHTIMINNKNDWYKLFELFEKYDGFIFRGQPHKINDKILGLKSSLERMSQKYHLNYYNFAKVEELILKEFKNKFHFYSHNKPADNEYFNWLGFIQHYGGATRLLDFTESMYIAIYFSFYDNENDASIYCLKKLKILENMNKSLLNNRYNIIFEDYKIKEEILKKNPKEFHSQVNNILLIYPTFPSERINIQQGLFITYTDLKKGLDKSFIDDYQIDLSKEKKYDINEIGNMNLQNLDIFKLVIKKSLYATIIKYLRNVNITHSTLFPGLDGFGKSLNFYFLENKNLMIFQIRPNQGIKCYVLY